MARRKNKKGVWKIRRWTAAHYEYSTSDKCLEKVQWDRKICYDPMNHQTHQCEKEKCPLYYDPLKDE